MHVLGTPPAFILSQDQTLRRWCPRKGNSHAHRHDCGVRFSRDPKVARLLHFLLCFPITIQLLRCGLTGDKKPVAPATLRSRRYRLQTHTSNGIHSLTCAVCCLPLSRVRFFACSEVVGSIPVSQTRRKDQFSGFSRSFTSETARVIEARSSIADSVICRYRALRLA